MKEAIESNIGVGRLFFFWAGIVATLAYRAIIILNAYSNFLVSVAWYIGTIGFVLYFGHRAHVEKKRAELVEKNDLIAIVGKMKGFSGEQREALDYIVRSSITSRVRWNSLFIFWSSVVALIVGVILDFVLT
jgi:hypothetical protein